MCSQRERQRERGDDYIPGNKCGLSTAGMNTLSGVAVAYGLEDVSGSAIPLNNMYISLHLCAHSCRRYASSFDWHIFKTLTTFNVPKFVNNQFVAIAIGNEIHNLSKKHLLWLTTLKKLLRPLSWLFSTCNSSWLGVCVSLSLFLIRVQCWILSLSSL